MYFYRFETSNSFVYFIQDIKSIRIRRKRKQTFIQKNVNKIFLKQFDIETSLCYIKLQSAFTHMQIVFNNCHIKVTIN